MSTRNNSWGKGGRCVGLATLPPSCADCLEICAPQTPVTLWAFQACNGIALPFYTPCTMGVNYRRLLRRNKSTYSFRETKIFEESRRVPPFINFLFPPPSVVLRPDSGSRHPLRGFAITLFGPTIVSRTLLDERSAQRRDLYLTTHNTHNGQTSMPPPGFQPTSPARERP